MIMLHVYDQSGDYVASVSKQDKLAPGYRAHEPWLLLRKTGRTDRFALRAEALEEAKKSWPACRFSRH